MAPQSLGFTMLAFLLFATLPAEGLRRAARRGAASKPVEHALSLVGEGRSKPNISADISADISEPKQVDWEAGDIVGWVGEGTTDFPVGGRAQLLSFFVRGGRRFAYVHYQTQSASQDDNVEIQWASCSGSCRENGSYDSDCCATESDGGCLSGYTRRLGDYCAWTTYARTTCCVEQAPRRRRSPTIRPGAYSIISGTGCRYSTGGCITSRNYPSRYGDEEDCVIGLNAVGLEFHYFGTESGYDVLWLGGYGYSGSSRPSNGTYSGSISWVTDYDTTSFGWKVCFLDPSTGCDANDSQLIPIDPADCPSDPDIDPCNSVGVGQLCEGDGECGTTNSLNNCGGHDVYRKVANEALPYHPTDELYKANATEYGCEGGSRAKFVGPPHNTANILSGQEGIVQAFSFSNNEHLVNWWDLDQSKGWAVPPLWLRCQQAYWPRAGNGAWVGLHSVNAGTIKIWETIGTAKTVEETRTSIWASELTRTISGSMTAGVGFKNVGIEVSVGGELSRSLREEQATTQAYSWTMNKEEGYELELPPNSGYLWQWHVRTQLESGEVYTSRTRNFALTAGLFERPRCVPGYQTDGAACQVCYSEEATIQGLPAQNDGRAGSAVSKGLLLGALAFGLFHAVSQA